MILELDLACMMKFVCTQSCTFILNCLPPVVLLGFRLIITIKPYLRRLCNSISISITSIMLEVDVE
jgi:hypothetical protein